MNRKLRVLCFGRFCDEVPGGTQSHVESLCNALSDSVEFTNLVPSRDRQTSIFNKGSARVYRMAGIPAGTSVSLSWRMVLKAVMLHRKYRYDLVHLHFPDPMSHIASYFIPWSVPRVISWHSDILRQKKLLFFYKPFLRRALNSAHAVFVATPAHISSSEFLHYLRNPAKLHIVPYGINPVRFEQSPTLGHDKLGAIQAKAGLRKIVFALGRHVYYKGFEFLIRAMAQSKSHCFLVLGGSGPLTEEFRQLVHDLDLQNSVYFAGFIPDEELPAWFALADIFCLPSIAKTEAFGIVQLEAMATGKPVISTALNNGVDYVNQHLQTGLVVKPGDVQQLVDALLQLAHSSALRQQMGIAGQLRVRQEFSEQRMAELALKAYQGCMQKA